MAVIRDTREAFGALEAVPGTSSSALLPIMGAVFVSFLVIGLALPALPLHVHQDLGLGTFIVGLVAGSQFAAAVVSRVWAGRHADLRGAKRAMVTGLVLAVVAGLLYALSLAFIRQPALSVAILLAGRAVLGGGESFIITGAQAWGFILGGARSTGKVIAWMGTAMYAAFALGAPIGSMLYGRFGFMAIALATTLLPLAALIVLAGLHGVAPTARVRSSFSKVVKAVWLPGIGLALTSTGFGAMTAFVALLFAAREWPVWPAFTAFAALFILARSILGNLADRRGGAKVALVFLMIEACGQAMLWFAPSFPIGVLGAALTGFGYSLVYPGFGVEAVRRAPADSRGLAMGAYTAFLDVALALASPLLGLLAAASGIGSVFLASAVASLCAAPIALRLMKGSK
jgi:MFS family permease